MEDARVELNRAIKQLIVALAISILLIFLTLIFQFGKVSHSLIIMTAIPLGSVGGILSLWLFNSSLSLNAFLGVILLNGIAVNNSIILVDFILEKINSGLRKKDAILVACKLRLRPIIITSLTTILGMTPIALGMGEGGKILRPLGLAVTGGLWFSMFFTLFVVPFLESILLEDSVKKEFNRDVADSNSPCLTKASSSEELQPWQ